MDDSTSNPYLNPVMRFDRLRSDALAGVHLAREAWRARDPEGAAKELGRVIQPGHECELAGRVRRISPGAGKPKRARKTRRTKP